MYDQDKQVQQKIRQMNEMPEGVGFNIAATWSRIEDQLQPVTSNKKAWLRIAAILILVIAGLAVYLLSTDHSPEQTQTVAGIDDPGQTTSTVSKNKPDQNVIATTTPETKQEKQKATKDRTDLPAVENVDDPVEIPLTIATTIEEIPATTLINSTPGNNSTPVTATNTTVKKTKLRILHLDELYKPDPVEIAKAETKRQQASEDVQETEPVTPNPPKPFWKSKTQPRIAISLTDNQ